MLFELRVQLKADTALLAPEGSITMYSVDVLHLLRLRAEHRLGTLDASHKGGLVQDEMLAKTLLVR